MPRLLAIEWDNREARVAVATTRGADIAVDDAFVVPLSPSDDADGKGQADPALGRKLSEALASRQLRKGEALVAVGRTGIELKRLALPPAPDDELPDMVRFQALREFNTLGEDWPLDYLPLGGSETEPRSVLAAAISPELVAQMRATCAAAGVAPEHLVLRSCSAASLFLRRPEGRREQVRLLVDLLSDEVDLTVLAGEHVVFLRTARLPPDVLSSPDNQRPLLAEIRRTLVSAQNQEGVGRVEAVYLCGTPQQHAALVERMQQELDLPARLFEPFAGLQGGAAVADRLPGSSGRFAPLLGMLANAAAGTPQPIDFFHPRRPKPPENKRKKYLIASAVAASFVAIVALFIWQQLASLDEEIARQTTASKGFDPVVRSAAEIEKAVAEIRKWTSHDVVWLDELRELSAEFPPAKDAMLTQIRMGVHPDGGVMYLDGLVREGSVVDSLEKGLRDGAHRVEGQGRQLEPDAKTYSWRFSSSVVVTPSNAAATTAAAAKTPPIQPTPKP